MENEIKIKRAFTETFVILNELNFYNKIPDELKMIIECNYDSNLIISFDKDIPLFNQISNDITRNLITYIYFTYIDKDNSHFYESELNNIWNNMDN